MQHYRLAGLTGIDALHCVRAATPRPGPGEVLVRMRAASLNYRDLLVARGGVRGVVPPDLVPLSDGAGEIVEVGQGVGRWQAGDRVAGIFYQSWLGGPMTAADAASGLGGNLHGVLTQYRVFDSERIVRVPAHLSYEEAATLPCAAVTAWNALYGARPLQVGQSVLVIGTGGVATFALQLAAAAGARPIVVSSSEHKLPKALALGAVDGVNSTSHPEWHKEVRRLTGGRGVDHVVETGGAGTLERSLGAVRFGGIVHMIGVLTSGQVNPALILGSTSTVRGVLVGSREMFEQMNEAMAHSALRPVIERSFGFEDVAAAYRALEGASHVGKIVVRID